MLEYANARIIGEHRMDMYAVRNAFRNHPQFECSPVYAIAEEEVREIERTAWGKPEILDEDLHWAPGKRWVIRVTGTSTKAGSNNILDVLNDVLDKLRGEGTITGLCLPYVFDQIRGAGAIDLHLARKGLKRVSNPLGGPKKVVQTYTRRELVRKDRCKKP